MRRQLGGVIFLTVLLAFMASHAYADRVKDVEPSIATAPVAVQRVSGSGTGLRDEAAMVLVGTALIGLAAAVRRAA